ncbi:OLC1v1030535C1 [Oldenlandia corymbosa var. corymbosa]|uniref:OLC1v1030535C1 n=1 Tax=Oldenlandia corymbosa var. corymbosa TaxID=529605 RepID=A0AAV1CI67_OLDCO|nr:OLC1v1030535C1 [Oldenlandia corymbosa var. corymbosa]
MLTLTLLDICIITGLTPAVPVVVDVNLEHPGATGLASNQENQFCRIMDSVRDTDSATQHRTFLAFWLNRYVFCSKSLQMTMNFYHLARVLATGKQVDLASALLGGFYRSMFEPRQHSEHTLSGPLWLLILWLEMYFPALRSSYSEIAGRNQPLCYKITSFEENKMSTHDVVGIFLEVEPDISVVHWLLDTDYYHRCFGLIFEAETRFGHWDESGTTGMRRSDVDDVVSRLPPMLSTPTPSASTKQTRSPSSNLLSPAALRARLASLKTGAPRASMSPLAGASVTKLSKKIINTPVGQVFATQSHQIKKDLEALMFGGMTSLTAEIINEFLAKFNDLQKQYISNSDIRKNLPIYEANLAKSQERVQTCAQQMEPAEKE